MKTPPEMPGNFPPDENSFQPKQKKKDLWGAYLVDLVSKQIGLTEAMESIESALIHQALELTGDNVVHAATLLKIPRGTLRYKMDKYGLGPKP